MAAPRTKKRHPIDVPKLRKMLIWGTPLYLGCICLCWFITKIYVANPFEDIRSRAPVVEILGMALIGPLSAVFAFVTLLLLLARAFYLDTFGDWVEQVALKVSYVLVGLMLIIAVISYPLQSYFMPQLGYTRCGILYGHSSVVSPSRWLRYPELCVFDKSVKWVKEESAKIERARALPAPLPKEIK